MTVSTYRGHWRTTDVTACQCQMIDDNASCYGPLAHLRWPSGGHCTSSIVREKMGSGTITHHLPLPNSIIEDDVSGCTPTYLRQHPHGYPVSCGTQTVGSTLLCGQNEPPPILFSLVSLHDDGRQQRPIPPLWMVAPGFHALSDIKVPTGEHPWVLCHLL